MKKQKKPLKQIDQKIKLEIKNDLPKEIPKEKTNDNIDQEDLVFDDIDFDDRSQFQSFISRRRFINPSLTEVRPIENLEEELSLIPLSSDKSSNNSQEFSYSGKKQDNIYSSETKLGDVYQKAQSSYSSSLLTDKPIDSSSSFMMKIDNPMVSGEEMNLKSFRNSNMGYPGGDMPQSNGDNYILTPERQQSNESLPFQEKKKRY